MSRRQTTISLLLILSLCAIGRIAYVTVRRERMNALVVADMRTYNLLAKNLIEKDIYGFTDGPQPWRSYRPPLYPFFLSLIYRAAGYSYLAVRLAQTLLAIISCLLIYYIARELAGEAAALTASFLFAVDFSLVHLSGLFLSENLYLPLSLVVILLLMRGFRRGAWPPFIGAGVAGGLAALCRPTILPFLLFVGLVPVIGTVAAGFSLRRLKSAATGPTILEPIKTLKRGLAGWGLMLLFAGATIAPWTARNYRLHRAFIPISTNGGVMLWMGLHPGAGGGYDWPEQNNPLRTITDEVARNRLGIRESAHFIFRYPAEFFKLAVIKMRIFWGDNLLSWSGRQWAIIGGLGALGFFLSLRDWRRWLVIYIYLVSFAGIHLFVHSSARYRLPLHPLVEIWAALFLVRIGSMIRASLTLLKKAFYDFSF